ncbi:MAG: trypsin-like peptidase domain-containing protein [Firmicutes bacterium]|nr:trypsin-like peptidase domain-containing protein [Bacillota bacterium]
MDEEKRYEYQGETFVMTNAPEPEHHQPPRKKKRSGKSQLLAIILVVILAAGAGFGGGIASVYLAASYFPGLMPTVIYRNGDVNIQTSETMDVGQAIYEKVVPSVVAISTTSEREVSNFFGWGSQTQLVKGMGTGFIVDENGYILTNSHVVNDGQTKTLTVSLYDGRDVDGTVLWNDSTLDLAVVKIEADNLQAVELGDSDEIAIGQYAGAIGNPMSINFSRSFTQGVISGLNRTITVTDGNKQTTMENLIQTDATINSGNSGGPLLNSEGQVIGINSAKMSSAEGLGFAIPINTVMPIVEEIRSKGEFTKAYIGISGVDLSTYLNSYPDQDFGVTSGAFVAEITPGMGAEKAGLKPYDVITEINGASISGMNSLNAQLVKYRPGDTVDVVYYRDGQPHEVKIQLTAGSAA